MHHYIDVIIKIINTNDKLNVYLENNIKYYKTHLKLLTITFGYTIINY